MNRENDRTKSVPGKKGKEIGNVAEIKGKLKRNDVFPHAETSGPPFEEKGIM